MVILTDYYLKRIQVLNINDNFDLFFSGGISFSVLCPTLIPSSIVYQMLDWKENQPTVLRLVKKIWDIWTYCLIDSNSDYHNFYDYLLLLWQRKQKYRQRRQFSVDFYSQLKPKQCFFALPKCKVNTYVFNRCLE